MKTSNLTLSRLIALAFVVVLTGASQTFGQGDTQVRTIPNGQSMQKYRGIVTKRNADSFKMRDDTGAVTVVALTPQTEVKSHKKGVFRGSKDYAVSYILRGLRLEVDGTGNADGQLVADKIRFDEQDLRTAQSLQATLDPAEEAANARMAAEEQNAQKMAGQIEENTALANAAGAAAQQAQSTADEALKSATLANHRISGLSDYDPVRTITVLFAPGSSTLGPKGRAEIDSAAAWVKTQDTKGWVVSVVGFADTTGNTAKNTALSERRANAVIGYMVSKHNLPLQRLVQPFGFGDSKPVADNTTADGRAKNRRVEIHLLVNKGIAGIAQATP